MCFWIEQNSWILTFTTIVIIQTGVPAKKEAISCGVLAESKEEQSPVDFKSIPKINASVVST